MLDRSDRDDTEEVVRDDDFSGQVNPFRSSESSVIETGNKHLHNISQVHSRSIDSWLKDHFEQEEANQKQNIHDNYKKDSMKNVKQKSEIMHKDYKSTGDKSDKKMGKIHYKTCS